MANISVIVPVYKVEEFLSRCVDSILCQSYSDFEVILVDDGSPDRCGQMCEDYARQDSRIHVIHRKTAACPPPGIPASTGFSRTVTAGGWLSWTATTGFTRIF